MSNTPRSPKRVKAIVKAVNAALRDGFAPPNHGGGKGSAIREAARRLNIDPNTLHSTIRAEDSKAAKKQRAILPDWSLFQEEPLADSGPAAAAEVDPHSELAKENRRLSTEVVKLRGQLRDTLGRLDEAEDIRRGLLRLREIPDDPPAWIVPQQASRGTILTPILFGSDFQWGERVDPAEVDGMNEYNLDIAAERYQTLVERTIDLSDHHVGAAEFDRIVYLRGGDAISGEIHQELAETNDASAIPAVRDLLRNEREGVKRLRDRFGHVHVISIPGNHGRTTIKPRSKNYTDRNFETLLAWWLESVFDDDPRVTFQTPKSGDAYFDVLGWKFLLSHGDRMGSRGGQGFIGPAATIARGHKKLFDDFVRTGRRLDYVLTGHLHTSLKLELGYANGSLVGVSEYSRDLRATPAAAMQWLLYVHKKRGVTAQYEVQLSKRPIRQSDSNMERMAA
jgi:hypothetical protein